MRSFVLEEFLLVKGPIRFYKLRINGWSPLDDFWAEIGREGNLAKQLNSAVGYYGKGVSQPKAVRR